VGTLVVLVAGSGGALSLAAWMRTVRVEGRSGPAVGGDVVDDVGGYATRVENDVADECAVEEGLDTEVEIGLRGGDGRAQVGIGVADVDDGGVVAIDLDDGRCVGGRGGGAILRHGSRKGRPASLADEAFGAWHRGSGYFKASRGGKRAAAACLRRPFRCTGGGQSNPVRDGVNIVGERSRADQSRTALHAGMGYVVKIV
jgi:hypothetical protein